MQGSSHQPQNSQQQKCCGWSQAVTNNNAALKKEKEKKKETPATRSSMGVYGRQLRIAKTPDGKSPLPGVTVQQLPTRLNRAPIESIKTVPVGLVGRDGRDTGGEKEKRSRLGRVHR